MDQPTIKLRKNLNADSLFKKVKTFFHHIPDPRKGNNIEIPLDDALMAAFAMFSLKDPSLLQFEKRLCEDVNLKTIYRLGEIPSDTHMRTIIDEVDPETITPLFKDIFRDLQRGKVLEDFVFLEDHYLISADGTGYFSSKNIHCDQCLEQHHQDGTITYSHKMLGAALVHPDKREVIPLAPEMIVKQDGETKNDCEQNASKRLLVRLRSDHPKLKIILNEDALYANAPHLLELEKHDFHYIIGVKPGDHGFLFDYVDSVETEAFEKEEQRRKHLFRFVNDVPLNKSNQDVKVNFLEYWETNLVRGKQQHFSWITDIEITEDNAYEIMRGGRSRWKIENETFNTLKNQGYHFEHNYGHGKKHLSAVFALLMFIAFLIDQVQLLCCPLFNAVLDKEGSKQYLWEQMRSLFMCFNLDSMQQLYEALLYNYERFAPVIIYDSS